MVYKRSPNAESSHRGSVWSGVSGVCMEVEVKAMWLQVGSCELIKGLSLSPLRQGTTGCAHIHVPEQNCATGQEKSLNLLPEPGRTSSSFNVHSAPSTDKA